MYLSIVSRIGTRSNQMATLPAKTVHLMCRRPLLSGHSGCHKFSQTVRQLRHQTGTQAKEESLGQSFLGYLRHLRWVPIPLGVGFGYISYQQYGHVREREERKVKSAKSPEELVANDWQVNIYRAVPLNAMSRTWGYVNHLVLPVWLRSPLLKLYIWAFDCQLQEAAIRDLKHYKNLGEFFKRRLKPGCRPVEDKYCMTCPSDGKVLHFGHIKDGEVEQVKGVTYSLQHFLGPLNWDDSQPVSSCTDKVYQQCIKQNPDNELYHCVIYLAPGDYHGFHSPTTWTLQYRRHYPGDLLSVNPRIARLIKGLFNLNERAAYIGTWDHGFMAMVAVGATNVGSINVYCDRHLKTNWPCEYPEGTYFDESFRRLDLAGIPMGKGEALGEFNLGSTIVLVFEAPKDFKFKLKNGQKIKYGQPLGHVESS